MRYDIESGKVTELAQEKNNNISFLNSENDRYYFVSDNTYYFSTDENYENRLDDDKHSPPRNITGNKYFVTQAAKGYPGGTLISVTEIRRPDGNEKVLIEGSTTMPIFYNGNIIYSLLEERYPIGYAYQYGKDEPSPIYENCGGKYYICNTNGSNQRLLCDVSGGTCVSYPGSAVNGDILGADDYIILKLKDYKVIKESDEKGRRILESIGEKYISVDIKTGEYKTVTMG